MLAVASSTKSLMHIITKNIGDQALLFLQSYCAATQQ
jgi:hypothetical protein